MFLVLNNKKTNNLKMGKKPDRHFTNDDIQMVNALWKYAPMSLGIAS